MELLQVREELVLELKNPGTEPWQTPPLPPRSSSVKSNKLKGKPRKKEREREGTNKAVETNTF
jgi:hypothetical protein